MTIVARFEIGYTQFLDAQGEPNVRTADALVFPAAGPLRDFYPQVRSRIRDARYGARFFAIQDQIRLLQQPADVGARVMAGHRVVRVSEQDLAVFG